MVLPVKPGFKKMKSRTYNLAVNNNAEQYYPRAFASFPGLGADTYLKLNDGQFFYYISPANRWTTTGSNSVTAYAGIDFGSEQSLSQVKVYFIDDAKGKVKKPKSYSVEFWKDHKWQAVTELNRSPLKPEGGRANTVNFREVKTSKLRVSMTLQKGADAGISEIEAWSPSMGNAKPEEVEVINAAYFKNAKAKASFTSSFDDIAGINDGLANPAKRWTAFESPNASDWVSFSFDKQKEVSKVYLYFYSDKNGVQPPADYQVEYWNGKDWTPVKSSQKMPAKPIADLNICSFSPVNTTALRVVLTHQSKKIFTGLYEVEIY